MYIDVSKNNGKSYLRLVNAVRVENKNGYKISKKQVILNLGPLDRFDDGKPDFLERLRQSFRAGNPLIPELKPYCSVKPLREKYSFTIEEDSPDCISHPKLISQLLIERILEELNLHYFFSNYKTRSKIEFDLYGFFRLLLFGRILHPASKSATVRQNEDYYEPVLKEFNPDNVYDTLDFLYENKERIVRRINTSLVKKAHRSSEIIFYDVTNFYFEIEDPDDDETDSDGNVLKKGQRKMGVSKEQRKQPIVQMGLFMDDEGIPISIETFPGNTLDHQTLKPALKKNIDGLELSHFILIGDRGICSYSNLLHVLDEGNGYIVSKSLLKSAKEEREWAYDNDAYISVNEGFKYKSRIVSRMEKDEHGTDRPINELVVVYWSKKIRDRELAENKSFLEFLEKLESNPSSFRITKLQSKSLRKFMKKEYLNKATGELLDSDQIKPLIDFDKVREYKEEMGYYQIVTSELSMDPREVIDKYHGLTEIEDQFRVMKGTLQTRPIYVRTPEHVEAHLLVCLIALIVMRIIQKKVADHEKQGDKGGRCWTYGISAERVQEALNKWKVEKLPGELYRFTDIDDPDLKRILDAFGIEIPKKLYRRAEMKQIKTSTEIFT